MLEYMEPVNCEQTTVIVVCKQINSESFKNKITNKLLIKNHIYNHLTVCKQISVTRPMCY